MVQVISNEKATPPVGDTQGGKPQSPPTAEAPLRHDSQQNVPPQGKLNDMFGPKSGQGPTDLKILAFNDESKTRGNGSTASTGDSSTSAGAPTNPGAQRAGSAETQTKPGAQKPGAADIASKPTVIETYTPTTGGKAVPVYSHKENLPMRHHSYDPKTGEIKQGFHEPFGIKDEAKSYGGVWNETETSRTLARREVKPDGTRIIEFKDMKGIYGYGKSLGVTGHRQVLSATLSKEPDGKAYQEATIMDYNWRGKLVPSPQSKAPMSSAEFDRRWKETDPSVLRTLLAETEPKKNRSQLD